jgi:hypothetical protein
MGVFWGDMGSLNQTALSGSVYDCCLVSMVELGEFNLTRGQVNNKIVRDSGGLR